MKERDETRRIFEIQGIKVIYFSEFYRLDLPNVRLLEPEQSLSGAWEAWTAFTPDADESKEEKLAELHTDHEDMTIELFFHVLAGIEVGFAAGLECGRQEVQNAASYALKALTGELDIGPLSDAADQLQ